MASVNKVILLGNLGADPETRYTTSGDAVTNCRIATSEKWTDKGGERQEKTEWHSLVFFGRVAEIVGEYCHKGTPIYVEGKLQTRKWQDKEGNDRYTTEVVCHQLQLLGKKSDGEGGDSEPAERPARSSKPAGKPAAKKSNQGDLDDDIPF